MIFPYFVDGKNVALSHIQNTVNRPRNKRKMIIS
jgi:hypothetical protein